MAKYKKRQDGRYATRVSTGRYDASGKQIVHTLYGRTIAELDAKVAAMRTDLRRGSYADDAGRTFREYAETWLKAKAQTTAPRTYKKYEDTVLKKCAPLHSLRLRSIERPDVMALITAETGHPDNQRMIRMVCRALFEQAVDDGLVYKNPAARITIAKHRPQEKRALTDAEKEALRSCDFTEKERLFLSVLYSTGLRRGEALGLRWADFDWKARTVHVQRSIDFTSGRPVEKETKSVAGDRSVSVPAPLCATLRAYMKKYPSMLVFPAQNGSAMSEATFRRFWARIYTKIVSYTGHEEDVKLTPHIFRHNYASELYARGVDVKTAQYLLGHASLTVTLGIYTHLAEASKRTAAEAVADMVL